jgi:hypothetical protein
VLSEGVLKGGREAKEEKGKEGEKNPQGNLFNLKIFVILMLNPCGVLIVVEDYV